MEKAMAESSNAQLSQQSTNNNRQHFHSVLLFRVCFHLLIAAGWLELEFPMEKMEHASFHSPNDADGRLPDLQCAVCTQRGHGSHFGVVACRPCAAFFRRCVAENRTYKCLRGTNNCDIRRDGQRNACKSCRLRICRQAGMMYGKEKDGREGSEKQGAKTALTEMDTSTSTMEAGTGGGYCNSDELGHSQNVFAFQMTSNGSPVLDRMIQAYAAFSAGERSLFMVLHPEAAFQNLAVVVPKHADNLRMEQGARPLMFQMLNDGIEPFARLDLAPKLALLDDSFKTLKFLHMASLTIAHFPEQTDTRYMPHMGHVLDARNLEQLLADWSADMKLEDAEEYVRAKLPIMRRLIKFVDLFKQFPVPVQQQDFCALIAIALSNIAQQKFGVLHEDWLVHKETIMAEWLADLSSRYGSLSTHAPAMQMSRLICTLVELNAITSNLKELSTVFRIFSPAIYNSCEAQISMSTQN